MIQLFVKDGEPTSGIPSHSDGQKTIAFELRNSPRHALVAFYHPAVSRFYKHWYKSKKKAFTRYAKKFAEAPQEIESELKRIKDHAQVVRVIAHTQVQYILMTSNLNRGNGKSRALEIDPIPLNYY